MSFKIDDIGLEQEVRDLVSELTSSELHVLSKGESDIFDTTPAEYPIDRTFPAFAFTKLDRDAARVEREAPGFDGEVLLKVQIASPLDLNTLPREGDPARIVFSDRHSYEGTVVLVRPFISSMYAVYIEETELV